MSNGAHDAAPPLEADNYIVSEGKKRGSTREVRADAPYDRFYTVTRVHAGDGILTDNWHTNEVFSHLKQNFEGYTFAVRTLEAWGAIVESDDRARYIAGGRMWVLDLQPSEGKKRRQPVAGSAQK
jgi:antirestriction protein ArdC